MAPSTALVVAGSDAGAAAAAGSSPHDDEDVDLPVDLSQLPMIPMPKSLLLINNFVVNTTRFLNHFAHECEERIARVSTNLTRVEIMLAILEAKLDSIPDLDVSESEIQAAEQSISGSAPVPASTEPSLGIDSQDLPSTDDGFGFIPPPPPPPPSSGMPLDMDGETETRLVGMPPPPPPPPPSGLPSADGDGSEMSNALVLAPSTELTPGGIFDDDDGPSGPPVLKLKDDQIYAKYFTMRRLGIPDPVIEQKLMLDGMDPSILSMDPEGPSPSGGSGLAPPPPSLSMPSPPPPPSGNIGMPFPPPPPPISPTSSTSSRAESLFSSRPPPPPDHFPATGAPPPLPPLPTQDDETSSDDDDDGIEADAPPAQAQASFLKLKDDPAFEKYFKMRKLGMPDGVIQHKLMMDGVTLDILSMDPEGPSPNAASAAALPPPPPSSASSGPPPPPLLPPMGRPGLPPPPVARFDGSDDDDDFDSDSD